MNAKKKKTHVLAEISLHVRWILDENVQNLVETPIGTLIQYGILQGPVEPLVSHRRIKRRSASVNDSYVILHRNSDILTWRTEPMFRDASRDDGSSA